MHVRVSPPDSDGVTRTRTMVLNNSLSVEYLDGQTKQIHSETSMQRGGIFGHSALSRAPFAYKSYIKAS